MDENVSNRLISLQTPHTLSAPQTNLHLDILMGRDETIEAADVFLGRFPHSYSSILF
jgi:proteasome maturation protein